MIAWDTKNRKVNKNNGIQKETFETQLSFSDNQILNES